MPAPGRALICGATLGPITAIPQEKMAEKNRERTSEKTDRGQHQPLYDKAKPQTMTAAVTPRPLWF
jgi:hypothetical protein